jgi:autotransporter translocation and assembly factor TamB
LKEGIGMWRKVLLAMGLAVLLLMLALYSGIADPLLNPLRDYVLKTAAQYLSRSLNGRLEVGALRGSLRAPVLHDIVLRDAQGAVVARVDELRLAYDLTSVFRWRLTIQEIAIVRPHVTLVQGPDGRLNLSRLVPERPRPPEAPSRGFGLPIGVTVERLQIRDGRLDLRLPSLPNVQAVEGVQLEAGARLDADGMRLDLRQITAHLAPADLTLQTVQGTVQSLSGVTQVDALRLQLGQLSLTADGTLPGSPQPADVTLQLHAADLTEIGRLLANDLLHGELHLALQVAGPPDALETKAQIAAARGTIDLQGQADTAATPVRYRATVAISRFDLTALLNRAALASDLNLQLRVDGEGLSLQDLRAAAHLELQPSHLGRVTLRPSQIDVTAAQRRFEVHRLDLDTSVAQLTAGGAIDLAGTSDLRCRLAANVADLRELLGIDTLAGSLAGQGRASGTWPALEVRGELEGHGLRYGDHRVQALRLRYEGQQLGGQPVAAVQLRVDGVRAGTVPLEQAVLEATYQAAERQARFTTEVVQSASQGATVHGTLALGEAAQRLVLDTVQLRLPDRTWRATAPLEIALAPGRIELASVQLAHGDESIQASGSFAGDRLQDLRLQASQLDLSYVRRLLGWPELVGGRATLQARLTGLRAAPSMQIELTLHADARQRPLFEQVHTTLSYEARRLHGAVRLQGADRDVLAVALQLPIDLALAAMPLEQRLVEAPLALQLDLAQPNLAALHPLLPTLPPLAGTLQGSLGVQGAYTSLSLHGDLQLQRLGIAGAAEDLNGRLALGGAVATAESMAALRRDLAQGTVTPKLQELTLRLPTLQGSMPSPAQGPRPFHVRDLLLEASGQWTPHGIEATLRTLRLRAQAFGMPAAEVHLAAQLTPPRLELSSLRLRLPRSEIRGHGHLTLPERQLQFRVEIPRLQLDELPLTLPPDLPKTLAGALSAQGSLQAPRVEARLRYAGAQIVANLAAQLQEQLPRYRAMLRVDGLDVAQLLPQQRGQLQTQLRIEGAGFSPERRRATLDLRVESSAFSLMPGLTMRLQANLTGNALQLDALRLSSTPVELAASGTLSAAKGSALTFKLTLGDLTPLQPLVGAELQARGTLTGELRGPLDALQARGALRLEQWRYAAIHGQRVQIDFTATQLPGAPQATVTAQLANLAAPSLPASSVRLGSRFAAPQGSFALTVTGGPYQHTLLAGTVDLGDGQRLTLQRLRLQSQDLRWENEGPITVVRTAQGLLDIPRLRLRSGAQSLAVQAQLRPDGPLHAEVHVQRLQIGPLLRLAAPSLPPIAGQIALDAIAGGTLQRPQAQGQLQLSALTAQKRTLGEIGARFALADRRVRTDLRWQHQDRDLLQVAGTLGLTPDAALDLQMRAPDLDLALLQALTPAIAHSAGRVNLDLRLAGTLQQPQPRGTLTLRDGALQLAATGERYRDMQAVLRFAGSRIAIERLHVGSRSGPLRVMGWIETAGAALQRLDLTLEANEFTAMHTPMIEAVITAKLAVRGSLQDLAATGQVRVPRARVILRAVPLGGPKTVQPWELTVAGVYGPGPEAAAARDGATAGPAIAAPPLPFLRADIGLAFPRNVWVQAPGTAVELGGDLRITKALAQPFILSGTVSTVRGFASFYGKKFNLQKGEVIFTGSPELNPVLNVTVTHTVSDYVVAAHVEGTARAPQITFSSTPELPQTDILSLLVLGKTTDRLTSAEQGALSGQLQQLAGGLVAGQLERVIGERLGIDTIEITPGATLGSGTISVGRYLTQDIFISIGQSVGNAGGPQVSIEYSITPRLKVGASSSSTKGTAVDFLWRLDY